MELRDALTQIFEIRQQVARTEIFRGFKALPVAFSGVLALTAAGVQQVWLIDPAHNLLAYLGLWMGAALVSLLATSIFVAFHCWHSPSPLTRITTLLVISQFLPCLVGGGLVTFILFRVAPDILWILPGLWAIFFSLGIFASYRLLPRATFWVGVYYMLAGLLILVWAQEEWAFSPLAMALPFGLGQFLAAGILYWTLERNHDEA
jgi:hypothetical protein